MDLKQLCKDYLNLIKKLNNCHRVVNIALIESIKDNVDTIDQYRLPFLLKKEAIHLYLAFIFKAQDTVF